MPSAFNVANSPLTSNGTLEVTGAGTTDQYVRGDGSLASFPSLTGFVPYTGATADVDLGTHDLTAERGTFANNGSSDTLTVNHTSGSGIGVKVTKGGNNEALLVTKTSGSGNAMAVVGGRTSLVDLSLSSVSNATGNFLTISGGVVHQRTASETRSDVGAQAQLNGTGFVKASGTTITYDNSTYQVTSEKGQPNGYASLDSNGKVPLTQINDALIGNVNYQGLWNASTNNPTLANPPSSGTKGYYYIVSTAGTFAGISFEVGDWIISNGSAWGKVDNTDAVSSVFGRTGNVTASNGDYNTSQVTENTNLYFTNARAIASTLTGYTSGAGTISATDSILSAIQKLNGNIGGLTTGVSSVFGRTGAVVAANGDYTTAQVTESGNLYFTTARVLATALTGYTLGTNTALAATDTILGAFGKVQGQLNAKENAITAGTTAQYFRGDKTFQTLNTSVVPELANLYFTSARVLATTLLGYTVGTNTALSATDSILGAFGKVQGQINAKQNALNGTGFVKIAGTTISYDNTSYLPLTGGTLTGTLNGTTAVFSNTVTGYQGIFKDGSDGLIIGYYTGGNGYGAIYASSLTINNSNYALIAKSDNTILNAPTGGSVNVSVGNTPRLTISSTGAATFTSSVEATSIIRTGGTSSQYLMADGSVSTLTNPVTGTGTAGQVAYWSSGSAITGESNLFWDATNDRLGIATVSTVSAALDVKSYIQIDTYAAGTTVPNLAGYLRIVSASKTGWAPNDELGKIEFFGSDTSGIGPRNLASIRAVNSQGNGTSTTTSNGELAFYTSATNSLEAERWRINSTGVLQSNGAQTIQSSTGNLTLATAGGNGNILLSPNGTGNVGINTIAPNAKFQVGPDSNVSRAPGEAVSAFSSSTGTETVVSFGQGATNGNTGVTLSFNPNRGGIGVNSGWYQRVDGTTADGFMSFGQLVRGTPVTLTERMRITSGGNVGIGTASPTPYSGYTTLHVGSASSRGLLKFGNASSLDGPEITTTTNSDIYLNTNGVNTRMVISGSTGNVLIGTTTDSVYKLDVNGTGRFSNILVANSDIHQVSTGGLYWGAASTYVIGVTGNTANGNLSFITGSTVKLTIASTGAATFSSTLLTEGNLTTRTTNSPTQSILLNAIPVNDNLISVISFGARFNSTTYGTGAQIRASAAGTWSSTNYGTNLIFSTVTQNTDVNTERMRITSGGNVLIGTTSDNGSRLRVNGSVALPHVTKSANYTLDNTDYTVGFDCASNRTATLPDATTCAGRIYVIYQYNVNNGMRSVTLDGHGSQTINGLTTYSLYPFCENATITIQSDGANWIIIGSNFTVDCM
jgi:hypothetical protein